MGEDLDHSNRVTRLLECALSGEVSELIDVLERHPDMIECTDKYHIVTPLHVASEYGSLSVVEALLARGANGNRQTLYGWTPLHNASRYGHFLIVEALLAKGADGNVQDGAGETPLYFASSNGHLSCVEALLAKGADSNIQNISGWTALHIASYHGHLPVVWALLDRGADENILNGDRETASYLAVKNNRGAVATAFKRYESLQVRRVFMMFLSDYQFLEPPARFPRESVVENVLVTEDLHRYLMSFL